MADTLLHRFSAAVADAGQRVAVRRGGLRVTYGELDELAADVAVRLRDRGVEPGDRVAVVAPGGVAAVAGYLGALRCGASYVPVDPTYPPARIDRMLAEAGAQWCVEEDRAGGPVVGETGHPRSSRTPGLVYVVFTSGTTGVPKGVMVEEHSLLNLLDDFEGRAPVPVPARCSWWTSPAFDVTAWEVWSALTCGHEIVVPTGPERDDGERFAAFLHHHGVHSAFVPAGYLPDLLRSSDPTPSSLARILVGVEPIPVGLLRGLRRTHPGLQVVNGYGPAEMTVCCTAYDVPVDDQAAPTDRTPIGRPISGTDVALIDPETGRPASGEIGELWFTGPGLARGYLNLPPEQQERFSRPPWDDRGRRWYRTGDLARVRPDGALVFDGRADRQVKVRGYRVELGEVERWLREHPTVGEAVVTTRADRFGAEVLVAAVTPRPGASADPDKLRAFVASHLPSYAVPAQVVVHGRLPYTASGKVDTAALARLFEQDERAHDRPEAGDEGFDLVLREHGVPPGVDESLTFTQLGGTSIAATALARSLRAYGRHASAHQVMTLPLQALRSLTAAPPADVTAVIRRVVPLTPMATGIWIEELRSPGTLSYVETLRFEVDGISTARLAHLVDRTIEAYPTFSACFDRGPDGRPGLAPGRLPVASRVIRADVEEDLARLLHPVVREVANLTSGPLFAPVLVQRRGVPGCMAIFLWHHAVCDAATTELFLRDLETVARGGRPPLRTVAEPDPRDHADAARKLAERLSPAPKPIRWPTTTGDPETLLRWHHADLDHGSRRGLFRLAHAGVRPLATMAWALSRALGSRYGRREVLAGLALSARVTAEQETASGCLVNTVPVRLDASQDVRQTANRVEEAVAAAAVPFQHVHRHIGQSPQVCLSWQEEPTLDLDPVRARARYVPAPDLAPKADLVLTAEHRRGRLSCSLQGRASIFTEAALADLHASVVAVLRAC